MIPFEHIEPYDLFFTKERYALRQLELVGLKNLRYLPLYCVPAFQHPGGPHRGGGGAPRGVAALVAPLPLPRALRARSWRTIP